MRGSSRCERSETTSCISRRTRAKHWRFVSSRAWRAFVEHSRPTVGIDENPPGVEYVKGPARRHHLWQVEWSCPSMHGSVAEYYIHTGRCTLRPIWSLSSAALRAGGLLVPNREGKCCDAVVRHIERARGCARTHVRDPEKTGGDGCVDLLVTVGDQAYALEHTIVQPFPNRIGLANAYHFITACIEQWFPLPLPGSAFYELHIPLDIRLPGRGKKGERRLAALREWIDAKVDILQARAPARPPPPSPYFDALDRISGRPCGWSCGFTVARSRTESSLRESPDPLVHTLEILMIWKAHSWMRFAGRFAESAQSWLNIRSEPTATAPFSS